MKSTHPRVSKDASYNKKRKPILRVEVTTADTAEEAAEIEQMKVDLVKHSGTAKQGVIDMYRFAKKKGFFSQGR